MTGKYWHKNEVCAGNEGTVEGETSKCNLNSPIGLVHYGDTVYIGAWGNIVKIKGTFFNRTLSSKGCIPCNFWPLRF